MDLKKFRENINKIDDEILSLLAQRRELVGGVIEYKDREDLQLRDAHREEQLLARLIAKGREMGLDAHAVTTIFHEIIDDSVKSQQTYLQRKGNPTIGSETLQIAYQGAEGNFSQLAARKFFSDQEDNCSFTGYAAFAEVVEAVEEGVADYGLLPVENTTAGVINEVYDLLLRTKLSIVGEEILQIRHCLLAIEEVPLSKIRRVLSQWQALGQCSRFLAQLENCHREPMIDTAMAVRKVVEDQDLSQAAIASEDAARLYGLKVIERNITDHPDNLTRFIIVAPEPVTVDLRIPAKTSLIVATEHQAGALMKALIVLQRYQINMTKLESRPRKGARFEYVFYIDFEGNVAEPRVEEALAELRGETSFLKILGTYPIEQREKTVPSVKSLVGRKRVRESGNRPADRSRAGASSAGDAGRRHRLSRRVAKPRGTVLRVGDAQLGGAELVIIAGPAVVESDEQILACAREVKESGGQVLYGGCFQTPVSPRDFAGLGWEGLEMLVEAGRRCGLPVMTEVVSPADVERAAELAQMLMVGHQNMHNYPLLTEVGGVHRPVVLQRGMAASPEQFLDAAEFILAQGNQQVVLCEHGISTFETTTRNTLDLGGISILKKMTHLPIVADPSHAAGQQDLVLPLALAARAVGTHGLIIEMHPQPREASSAGTAALDFDEFRDLVAELHG